GHQQREGDALGVHGGQVSRGGDFEDAEQEAADEGAGGGDHSADEERDEAFDARNDPGHVARGVERGVEPRDRPGEQAAGGEGDQAHGVEVHADEGGGERVDGG